MVALKNECSPVQHNAQQHTFSINARFTAANEQAKRKEGKSAGYGSKKKHCKHSDKRKNAHLRQQNAQQQTLNSNAERSEANGRTIRKEMGSQTSYSSKKHADTKLRTPQTPVRRT